MAVIKDVAKLAEVSVGAVSKYLKNHDHMREDTRSRIEAAIRELNYHPSPLARSLRTRKTRTVSVMMPPVTNPFFAELFNHIRLHLLKKGYAALLQTANDVEELRTAMFNQSIGQMDGVILCFMDDEKLVNELAAGSIGVKPLVALSWHRVMEGCGAVIVDIRGGMRQAVGHLLQSGCTRIAYIGGPSLSSMSNEKYIGYVDTLTSAGLKPDESMVIHGNFTLESGYHAAGQLLQCAKLPDAVAAENDILAVGCIKRLIHQGLRVPQDILVTGFDDIPLSMMYEPQVTTIRLPIEQLGHAAVDVLAAMMEGEAQVADRVFGASLIVRRSTDAAAIDGF